MMLRSASRNLPLLALVLLTACSSLPVPSLSSLPGPWSRPNIQPNASAEAVYNEGLKQLAEKRYPTAIILFQKVKEEYPFSPQLIDAELKTAEAFFLNRQYPEAITEFQDFQALHPTNENIPFVVYHLGLAHLNQFTSADRDQKTTGIAKGYFERVIKNYPNSAYATPAKEKLAQCMEHLAAHEFGIASFYLKDEKYPAARERFEEIVRRYPGTSISIKALYHLGESYRLDKNPLKAALAYQAVIQHHPDDPLAKTAQTRLAEVATERQDPLAMLLMRDGRAAPPSSEPAVTEYAKPKAKDLSEVSLVAKTAVVHEEPDNGRGILRRVVDTLNPFASSREPKSNGSNDAEKTEQPPQEASRGFWSGLNPFSSKEETSKPELARDTQLVGRIDESLNKKGVSKAHPETADIGLQPPVSDLPKFDEKPARPAADTAQLVADIDGRLSKDGKHVTELPPVPEMASVFMDPSLQPKGSSKTQAPTPAATRGLIANIDKSLQQRGIEAPKTSPALPTPAAESAPAPKTARPEPTKRKVELDTKLSSEKGPLFLETGEFEPKEGGSGETDKKAPELPAPGQIPQAVVKGPPPVKEKPAETQSAKAEDEEDQGFKGALDRLKEDMKGIGKLMNPFGW